jgi:demethylmenaquinone methyltransferase/2-methoxy-6-polyprenyl-1,4-benzoquinol methylase
VVGIELSRGMAGRTEIEPGAFDTVVSSFGLKTFDEEQQARLAQRVAHALRPGGAFSFIEISAPRFAPLRWLYMFYVKHVIPIAGWVLLGNPANYRMLGVYTDAFGDCRHFARCAQGAGLDAEYVSYFFGCATGVRGRKRG